MPQCRPGCCSIRRRPATIRPGWADRAWRSIWCSPERKERASLEAGATTLFGRDTAAQRPDATLTGPRRLILGLLFLKVPLAQLEAAGLRVEGDRAAVEALAGALDPMPGPFNIVEP